MRFLLIATALLVLSSCDGGAGFGFETGVYEVLVRSAFEEKELKARFAGRAGQNCCNCIPGETVDVVLEVQ